MQSFLSFCKDGTTGDSEEIFDYAVYDIDKKLILMTHVAQYK